MLDINEVKTGLLGAVVGLGLASGPLLGQSTIPFIDFEQTQTLTGGAGAVNIVEVAVVGGGGGGFSAPPVDGGEVEEIAPIGVPFSVGYFVDVQSPGVTVGSFAVSLTDFSDALSTREGWSATSITAGAWDMGVLLPNGLFSTDVGAFADFFEPISPAVAFFTSGRGPLIDEASDSDAFDDPFALEFGLGAGELFSSTLIFDQSGGIVDGTAIPEPSISLLGLLALGAFFRRRR